jgi:hypothetical protein
MLPHTVSSVHLNGSFAYLAAYDVGLMIVNIADPAHPALVSVGVDIDNPNISSQYSAVDVAVLGNYAYLVTDTLGLQIVDVSNPAFPQTAGYYMTSKYSTYRVRINGGFAFVVDNLQGLLILDLANPIKPIQAGIYPAYNARDVFVAGNYAYLIANYDLRIVDVSKPGQPLEVGIYTRGETITRVTVSGDYAYISEILGNLLVVNISKPDGPILAGSTGYPGETADLSYAGGYVFVAARFSGLHIIDVRDPLHPVESEGFQAPIDPRAIYVNGDYAYLADNDLKISKLSGPVTPTQVGQADSIYGPTDVFAAGNYAYPVGHIGLKVVDVSNPAAPSVVGDYLPPGHEVVMAVFVNGNYAYLATQDADLTFSDSLRIVNISNPPAPIEIGSIKIGKSLIDVSVSGNYAYMTAFYQPSLWIVDVSKPSAPKLAGIYNAIWYPQEVQIQGQYAYICAGDGSFRILDVSNPVAPVEVGAYVLPVETPLLKMFVSGTKAYLSSYGGGVTVVDVSDPTHPVKIGGYSLAFNRPEGMFADNNAFYVTGGAGMEVLRYTGLSVGGQIQQANGLVFPGPQVSIGTSTTQATGPKAAYLFDKLPTADYTITPSHPGYVFDPPSRTVSLPPSLRRQDFTILPAPVSTDLLPDSPASLAYSDTQSLPTSLVFPTGAVTQTMTATVTPSLAWRNPGYTFTGHAFDLEISQSLLPGYKFGAPVQVSIQYSDWDVRTISDETQLTLWWWDGNAWMDAASTCDPASTYTRDVQANALSVSICKTGKYALFGRTYAMYLPLLVGQ